MSDLENALKQEESLLGGWPARRRAGLLTPVGKTLGSPVNKTKPCSQGAPAGWRVGLFVLLSVGVSVSGARQAGSVLGPGEGGRQRDVSPALLGSASSQPRPRPLTPRREEKPVPRRAAGATPARSATLSHAPLTTHAPAPGRTPRYKPRSVLQKAGRQHSHTFSRHPPSSPQAQAGRDTYYFVLINST